LHRASALELLGERQKATQTATPEKSRANVVNMRHFSKLTR
jgi:hypothetical protein